MNTHENPQESMCVEILKFSGNILISDIINGVFHKRMYIDYSKQEAIQEFLQEFQPQYQKQNNHDQNHHD